MANKSAGTQSDLFLQGHAPGCTSLPPRSRLVRRCFYLFALLTQKHRPTYPITAKTTHVPKKRQPSKLTHQWQCQDSNPESLVPSQAEFWRQCCNGAWCKNVAGGEGGWLNTAPQVLARQRRALSKEARSPSFRLPKEMFSAGGAGDDLGDELRLLTVTGSPQAILVHSVLISMTSLPLCAPVTLNTQSCSTPLGLG